MSKQKDIGNKCVECMRDTSFSSSPPYLFVNRIPATTDKYDGYLCPQCQDWGDDDEEMIKQRGEK